MADICNQTVFYEKPPDICIDNSMKLTQTSILSIGIYSVLFALSSVCNVTMFSYLCCGRRIQQSRMNKFMFHLSVADLLITFITIPMEAGWKLSGQLIQLCKIIVGLNRFSFANYPFKLKVYWRAGALGCKFFQFLRPIGNYLASFVVISLCIDRQAFFIFCY
jgi:gonadotropin-releasing hormone receptor